jgi:hypothetical protein
MKKARKPEVKLEVDRAVDRSWGVAGLKEIGSDICGAWEAWEGIWWMPRATNRWIYQIMVLAIRLHKVSAIFLSTLAEGNLAIA